MNERVLIRREDIEEMEHAGYALYRAHENELALRMHALALRFRSESGFVPLERIEQQGPALRILKGGAA